MNVLSEKAIKTNFGETLDSVCRDHVTVVITRQERDESAVLISLDEYNRMRETAYLLGTPANAEWLRGSIAEIEAGKTIPVDLDDLDSL